jgi:AraC family transcriptional regulator, transcriptional activator of pobA
MNMNSEVIPSELGSVVLQPECNHYTKMRFEIHHLEDLNKDSSILADSFTRKNCFQIIWIKKGRAVIQADTRVYSIHDKMIYCIAPGTAHKFLKRDNELEGYYIFFNSDFMRSWQGYNGNPSFDFFEQTFHILFVSVTDTLQAELEIIARSMRYEYMNSFNQKVELLRGLLNIFVIYFSRRTHQEEETAIFTRESFLCKKFLGLVRKNFTSMKMVSDYANLLSVTPNYLNRTVKKISGFTASYHIQQQIIIEAKRQAAYCGSSLKEIAYYLGFDNLAHFSKFFKNNSGTSFSCFRKGMLVT